jgi:hypothetical protein
MKACRGQSGLLERGLLASAILSLSIAFSVAAATGCIAQTELSPDSTSSTSTEDGKGTHAPTVSAEGLVGSTGTGSGGKGAPEPGGVASPAPQPSPWILTPGSPNSDPDQNSAAPDPGTGTSPQPSPWMTPPSESQEQTAAPETQAAPSPTGPSKNSSTH